MERNHGSAVSSATGGAQGRAAGPRVRPWYRRFVFRFTVASLALSLGGAFYVAQPIFGVETVATTLAVDPSSLRTTVERLVSLAPRTASHRQNLDLAADFIAGGFASAGVASERQVFTASRERYQNVVAHVGPSDGPRVVVGAHYDAAGPGIGADDNASGVAGLLEIARILASAKLATRVDLVAFTLEEPPFFRAPAMGSAVYAESLKKSGVVVRAMLCLEMIGFYTDAPASQRYPVAPLSLLYPSRGNFAVVVGRVGETSLVRTVKRSMAAATTVDVRSINAPRSLPGIDFSDHASFWDAGYPAVMISDTAFYRNANYHEASDTPDTLDYPRMASVVGAVAAAVRALSGP